MSSQRTKHQKLCIEKRSSTNFLVGALFVFDVDVEKACSSTTCLSSVPPWSLLTSHARCDDGRRLQTARDGQELDPASAATLLQVIALLHLSCASWLLHLYAPAPAPICLGHGSEPWPGDHSSGGQGRQEGGRQGGLEEGGQAAQIVRRRGG